jgi:hypothetical protein
MCVRALGRRMAQLEKHQIDLFYTGRVKPLLLFSVVFIRLMLPP